VSTARRAVSVLAALLAVGVGTPVAGASSTGGATLDGGELTVHLSVELDGEGDGGAGGDGAASPLRYEVVPLTSPEGSGTEHLCTPSSGEPVAPGTPPLGWSYLVIAYDTDTGDEVSREVVCVPLGPDGRPVPGEVPSPPTVAEIWRAVDLPVHGLGVDPAGEGVVGLETYVWTTGARTAQVRVHLHGFSVRGSARVVEVRVEPGDGGQVRVAGGGSVSDPAVTHVYETKGLRPLRVTAVWEADVTMTGPGLRGGAPVALGRALLTVERAYRVVEVRAVLLG
jgi:hypothetical protein